MKSTICERCGKVVSNNNISRHIASKACQRNTNPTNKDVPEDLKCGYCFKICKSKNSFRQHERRCPSNPNRKLEYGMLGKKSQNKGLTKQTSIIIEKSSKNYSFNYKNGVYKPRCYKHTKESREKISAALQGKHQHSFASKRFDYNGVKLESTQELKVAESLDSHQISQIRPEPLVYRNLEGIRKRYYPDFYLKDFDVYVDPKNPYVTKLDKPKLDFVVSQCQIKLILLTYEELNQNSIYQKIMDSSFYSLD